MTQDTASIVNLTEQSWILQRSYGAYAVAACEKGAPYSATRVISRIAYMDLGDKRTMEVHITAREVAEDLCREINADGGDESFFGVFVAKGEEPTEAELAEAHERLTAFYQRLISAADREWERSHSHLFINDVQRRAAKHLGVEKEWHYQPHETTECVACGEKIKSHVAVCRVCGAIVNKEKAAKLEFSTRASVNASAVPVVVAPGPVAPEAGAKRVPASAPVSR